MKLLNTFSIRSIILCGCLTAIIFTNVNAQCNDPIDVELIQFDPNETIVDFGPWEANCGCGGNTNCRELNVTFASQDGVPLMCEAFTVNVTCCPDFGADHIDIFHENACTELQESTFQPSSYIVSVFPDIQSTITVFVCQGSEPNWTELRLGISDLYCEQPTICDQDIKPDVHVEDGDVYLDESCRGVVFTTPNGDCYRMTVDNNGDLETTFVSCPN